MEYLALFTPLASSQRTSAGNPIAMCVHQTDDRQTSLFSTSTRHARYHGEPDSSVSVPRKTPIALCFCIADPMSPSALAFRPVEPATYRFAALNWSALHARQIAQIADSSSSRGGRSKRSRLATYIRALTWSLVSLRPGALGLISPSWNGGEIGTIWRPMASA